MSKNNKPKTTPAKSKKESKTNTESKKKTAIIISASAIILVACILLGIFVVKPAIDNNKETTTSSGTTKKAEGLQLGGYTYVDYNGVQMAEPLAEILKQAEIDSAAAVEKYGVAVTIGDRKISRPEFQLYYQDEYRKQVTESQYSVEKTGSNKTGYDINELPDAQNHPRKSYTWAEEFTYTAIETMKLNYAGFDMAIKEGVQLEETEIADVVLSYSRVLDYADQYQRTPDEHVESSYTKGLTYNMFAAREIIVAYAAKYESSKQLELYHSYSEETILKRLEESNNKYKIVKARVYPIEGEYDAIEASKVRTEQEFIDYANNNYPYGEYFAETRTQCFYVTKNSIANTFGDEVGEWMFSPDRVQGETAVIQGQLFNYLCHIIELPYYGTSCHVLGYLVDHNEMLDEEGKQAEVEDVKKMLEDWKNGEATKESFAEIAKNSTYESEFDVRSGEYDYEINNWLFDKNRKAGDTAVFSDEYGIYMFYYVQKNEDDFDWDIYLRDELAVEEYEKLFEEITESEAYDTEMDSKIVNQVIKHANIRISKQIEERKNQSK